MIKIRFFKTSLSLFLSALLITLFLNTSVYAADDILSVSNVGTADAPAYVLYWPDKGGSASIERGVNGTFSLLTETTETHYVDYTAKAGIVYSYRVSIAGETLVVSSKELSSGKPEISDIKIEAGTTSRTEASVIVNFKTDKLAKAQCFYGETASYSNKTELDKSLNQSHTVLIEKLKPNTTYHFKVKAEDMSGIATTESTDQTFTTPVEPSQKTILEIIIEALSRAFSNFEQWFRS